MWLAFVLTFLILFLGIVLYKNKELYLSCVFGVFFILSAFRSVNVGNDTIDYKILFDELSYQPIANFSWRYEKGYLIYNRFLHYFSDNPQILFIVSALIICLGYMLFIKRYSEIPWLSVYLFFMLRYFDLSMNVLRQSLAMVILFFGFYLLSENKKIIYFILTVIFASFFHKTAIIFLIMILVKKIKTEKSFYTLLGIGTAVFFVAFDMLFQYFLNFFPTYAYYLDSSYMDGSTKVATVLNILVNLAILLFIFFNNYEKTKINQWMFRAITLGLAISIISIRFSLLDRVSDFFTVYAIVLLPNVLINKGKNLNLNVFLYYILLLSFFVYYIVIIVYRPEWNKVYPYEFFWMVN